MYVYGEPEAAWIYEGTVRALFLFSIEAARIASVNVIMEPAALSAMKVSFSEAGHRVADPPGLGSY